MKLLKKIVFAVFAAGSVASASVPAAATDEATATVGVQGYDLVSYHTGTPVRGTGHHIAIHAGMTYLFATAANLDAFNKDPARYLPAYGGYCAFGVTKGKKFYTDPLAWHIEDGTLYLNLDANVQQVWLRDVPGNIDTANGIWGGIKDVPAGDL